MDERIVTILMLIARQIAAGIDIDEERDELTLALTAQGFVDVEMEQAFEWIDNLRQPLDFSIGGQRLVDDSNRILSPEESFMVQAPAFGYLLKLKNMGIIDSHLMEEILDKSQDADFDEVGTEEIRLITIYSLYDRDSLSDWRRIIKHILDGGWESLRH